MRSYFTTLFCTSSFQVRKHRLHDHVNICIIPLPLWNNINPVNLNMYIFLFSTAVQSWDYY